MVSGTLILCVCVCVCVRVCVRVCDVYYILHNNVLYLLNFI